MDNQDQQITNQEPELQKNEQNPPETETKQEQIEQIKQEQNNQEEKQEEVEEFIKKEENLEEQDEEDINIEEEEDNLEEEDEENDNDQDELDDQTHTKIEEDNTTQNNQPQNDQNPPQIKIENNTQNNNTENPIQSQQNPSNNDQNQSQQNGEKPRKRYSVITQEVREKFIERVLSRQVTIKAAAKEFGIKFSTSKAILQTFKREGRTCKKKTRQRTNPRMVPSTITQEPLYGVQEQQMNNYGYEDNVPGEGETSAQPPKSTDPNQKDATPQQGQSKNALIKKNQIQQQQPHAVAGMSGLSKSSSFMNKLRFAGRGLSINTNWNLNNNLKLNFPQKSADSQFPNPFDSQPRQQLYGQQYSFGNKRLGNMNWDVKHVETQLKNIDVEVLKQQSRFKEITPQGENDFNYSKYFSTSDVY